MSNVNLFFCFCFCFYFGGREHPKKGQTSTLILLCILFWGVGDTTPSPQNTKKRETWKKGQTGGGGAPSRVRLRAKPQTCSSFVFVFLCFPGLENPPTKLGNSEKKRQTSTLFLFSFLFFGRARAPYHPKIPPKNLGTTKSQTSTLFLLLFLFFGR